MVLVAISIILTIVTLIYIIIGRSINGNEIDGITKKKFGNTYILDVVDGSRMRDKLSIAPLTTAIYGILPRKLHLNDTNQSYNVM